MRPPIATASPFSLKIGKRTRARSASCMRSRRLTKASPVVRSSSGAMPAPFARASQSSGAQPSLNWRAMSPASPRDRR
jgi:hypothetical protein